MNAFVIEVAGERKEEFIYDQPLNQETEQTLAEYAVANYGANAKLRRMNQQEQHEFKVRGVQFFKAKG